MVFAEGRSSEPDYINGLRRLPDIAERAAIDLQVSSQHGVPLTLVKAAKDHVDDDEIDEVWCVFDVEWPQNHPNLRDAVAMARTHGVKLAISNPCFEIWLILHHHDCSVFLTTDAAVRRCQKQDGSSGKSVDAAVYLPNRRIAADRARGLADRHAGNGTSFPADNPSSSMYLFLAAVEPPD